MAWKVCAEVANCRLNLGVILHDSLHRFRGGRGTGKATLESKLSQQLAGLTHDTLFQVFLENRKLYDSLDRDLYIEVLNGYGMGTNITCLTKSYWERHRIAPKTGKFLRTVFWAGRGLTQGDPASPMIFNIFLDVVVQAVLDVVYGSQEA